MTQFILAGDTSAPITEFPTPKNITDVRSQFGLLNQVAYAFSMAEQILPFKDLLKPATPFHWDDSLDQLFEESKTTITTEITNGVKTFDKTKPTHLATDWSRDGIGFWIETLFMPINLSFCCQNGWKITLVGSRFTNSAESRYEPIEGEALAVADALDKARYFVLGSNHLVIAVDHKPLLKIFGDRSLDQISNPRLCNLKENTLKYHFRMVHIPGAKNRTCDAILRHPTDNLKPSKMQLSDDIFHITYLTPPPDLKIPLQLLAGIHFEDPHLCDDIEISLPYSAATQLPNIQTVTWNQVRTVTSSDADMLTLLSIIEEGMPNHRYQLLPQLRHSIWSTYIASTA